jgi:vancomycin resistance protein VanJ
VIRHRRLLIIVLLAYSCGMLLFLALQDLTGDRFWPVTVFDWLIPFTVSVSLFLLLLSLRLRHWLAVGILGVVTLASFWNLRGLWSDGYNPAPNRGRVYTVMTHNAGNGLADPGLLVSVLRSSQADIIGLQEITPAQSRAIDLGLATKYPYRILFGDGIPGKGLLSKYPIKSYSQLHFYPDRPDLLATIQLPDGPMTVIVAHPPPPRLHSDGIYINSATRQQMDSLLNVASQGGPLLLMGDFNMTALSTQHARLRSLGLVDSYQVSGEGLGFTLPMRWKNIPLLPLARVDYIWHSEHFQSLKSWIGSSTGSDHLPVLTQLQWDYSISKSLQ